MKNRKTRMTNNSSVHAYAANHFVRNSGSEWVVVVKKDKGPGQVVSGPYPSMQQAQKAADRLNKSAGTA